jgi:hypothetical protein
MCASIVVTHISICHSFLGSQEGYIFSLERVYKRDGQVRTKMAMGYECASRTMSGFKGMVFAFSLEQRN